jgi:hypothetical protein
MLIIQFHRADEKLKSSSNGQTADMSVVSLMCHLLILSGETFRKSLKAYIMFNKDVSLISIAPVHH